MEATGKQNSSQQTSAAEMNPLPSLSKTRKASRSSSSESVSCSVGEAMRKRHGLATCHRLACWTSMHRPETIRKQLRTFILMAMRLRNSGKSMVPLLSASTSRIISCSSASVGFCPSERITVPSSLVVMVPCAWEAEVGVA